MKDKRQRMALSWPFGMVDPSMYSYLLSAAANLSAQGYHSPVRPPAWNFIHPALQVSPAFTALQAAQNPFLNCARPPQSGPGGLPLSPPLCGATPGGNGGSSNGNGTSPFSDGELNSISMVNGLSQRVHMENGKFSGFHPYKRVLDNKDLDSVSPDPEDMRNAARDLKLIRGLSPVSRKYIVNELGKNRHEETEKNSSNKSSPGKSFFRPFEEGERD
jgi:hypothetical protein